MSLQQTKMYMFVDDPSAKEAVFRMIRSRTANSALRDDLLQEALIHLWLTEVRRPGQTRSWYLQSCKFHLLHYLSSGCSVDSGKRSSGQIHFEPDADGWDGFPEQIDSGSSVLNWVSARELVSLLARRLLPLERAVLDCLADGLGPREIGRRLKISHPMVIKHRRKIASLLTRLEGPAVACESSSRANGVPCVNGHVPVNGTKPVNGAKHPAASEEPGTVKLVMGPVEIRL